MIPGRGGHKNVCGCRDLTTFASTGLLKNSGPIPLINTRYKAENNTTTFTYKMPIHVVTVSWSALLYMAPGFLSNNQ